MNERKGCNPLGWVFRRVKSQPELPSLRPTEPITESYLVRNTPNGIYVDQRLGNQTLASYFKTESGTWFLLANSGPGAIFDEDAQLNPLSQTSKYLSTLTGTTHTK